MNKLNQNIWKVKITINGNEQKPLNLYDAFGTFGEHIVINRNYFDSLIKSLKSSKNYNIVKGIEEIQGKDGKNWTKNPWLLLMTKNKEKNIPIWILLKRENDLTAFLVALGPDSFYDYISSSKDNIEEIHKLLEYIVTYEDKWKITVLIPNFLS